MKLILLVFLSIAADLAYSQSTPSGPFSTKKWAVKPHRAGYAKGDVVFQSNKGQNGEGTANKASLQSQINTGGKTWAAGRQGSSQVVQAKSAKGITATGDQSKKNPENGVRTGDAGKWHGELKNSKKGSDQNWNPSLATGQKIDTVMHGQGDSFDAAGSKGNKYNVDPDPGQSKSGGKGVITRNGEKYNYQENRASNGDGSAQLTNVGVGQNRKTYTCQAQKQGISNCVDQNGLKYGEVVSQPDGTVIVKKTIAKGVDVPLGKAKVVKDQNGKSVATVNDGMFQGQAGNYRERDCMADYGKTGGSKLKIEKPLTMNWNSQTQDGRRVFQFPDCITYGAKVTLPPGFDANRLAIQFDCSILPAGKLKCVDPGSCTKDCYYCNMCNNTRKFNFAKNADNRNMCNMKGGGVYQLSLQACPPPEDMDKAQCSGFTKADAGYWKRKGDIQCQLRFYQRSPADQVTRDKCYNSVISNSAAKTLLSFQYKAANLINANNPTDFDLCEYYVKQNAKPAEELVGCIEGTNNYTLSSQKVSTSFLIEAGSLATAPKSLFDTKPCPGVDEINKAEAQAQAADAKSRAPAAKGWSSFFGGR